MTGAERIAAERQRQIDAEGWTPEHDAEHHQAEMTRAAMWYAARACSQIGWSVSLQCGWPWAERWWKPSHDPIRNLEKAGALIAAEIDRLAALTEGGAET